MYEKVIRLISGVTDAIILKGKYIFATCKLCNFLERETERANVDSDMLDGRVEYTDIHQTKRVFFCHVFKSGPIYAPL